MTLSGQVGSDAGTRWGLRLRVWHPQSAGCRLRRELDCRGGGPSLMGLRKAAGGFLVRTAGPGC
eukprot:13638-Rhodomonas_salina.2